MNRFIVLSLLAVGLQIQSPVRAQAPAGAQAQQQPPVRVRKTHAAVKDGPYSATADAKAEVQQALAKARKDNKAVLVFFGANWCEDCRSLARSLDRPRNASLMAQDFDVVKVDVGDFDRNLDVVAKFGEPTANGIPAAVLLSSDGTVRYATKAGELSNARRMSDEGVHDFFEHVLVSAGG